MGDFFKCKILHIYSTSTSLKTEKFPATVSNLAEINNPEQLRREMSVPTSMLALRKTTPGPGYTLAKEPVPLPGDDEVIFI